MPTNDLDCFVPILERTAELANLFGSPTFNTSHLLIALIEQGGNELNSLFEKSTTADDVIAVYNSGALSGEHPSIAKRAVHSAIEAKRRSSAENCPACLLMGIIAQGSSSSAYQILMALFDDVLSLQVRLASAIGLTTNHPRNREAGEPVVDLFSQATVSGVVEAVNLEPLQPLNLQRGSILNNIGKDLTLLASQGKIDPIIGRDIEIQKAMQILMKRKKNNPVFIGEAGVGKTAIVEGLALKIANGNEIPKQLKNKRIFALSLSSLTAGTQYRGQFEEKIQSLLREIESQKDVIIFIDELHTVLGAGASEGGLDAANILKPALARGEFGCIGATTLDEYKKHIEKDAALERRFQPITIEEPTEEVTMQIVRILKPKYEKYHGVKYSDAALEASVKLTARYIHERNFPDKALDVIDEAGSRKAFTKTNGDPEVTEEDIAALVSEWTGVIVMTSERQKKKLLNIKEELGKYIIGQEEAVKLAGENLLSLKMGKQPIASFIFLGPTGVGKTELARKLALLLFGSEEMLIRYDMSEFQEKHQASRLIGAPPGYVGYEEGGKLIEDVRRRPYSVILFDEIEKAHPDVFDVLLQVLDDGRLTDGQGRSAYFENTIIIMTTNVRPETKNAIGFGSTSEAISKNEIHEALLKRGFRIEFINRVDETILFKSLSKKNMEAILELRLKEVIAHVHEDYGIEASFSDEFKVHLIDKGFDKQLGARELKRAIKRLILSPLGKKIAGEEFKRGDKINISFVEEKVNFDKI